MSIKLKLHTKNWLSEYKINNPINVTLTEKQRVNGIDLDRIRSEQNFRYFKNLLNTNIFGNGFKRFNKQLKMIVVREYSFNLRHHIHCIIEQPKRYSDLEFNLLIRKLWKKTLFGYSNIHIEKPTSLQREVGWFNYIMKDNIENSVDWNNSVL
jgi:hypothetical protein